GFTSYRRRDRDRTRAIERRGAAAAPGGTQRLQRLALLLVRDLTAHRCERVLVCTGAGPATRAECRGELAHERVPARGTIRPGHRHAVHLRPGRLRATAVRPIAGYVGPRRAWRG